MMNNWSFSSNSNYSSLLCMTTSATLIEDYHHYTIHDTEDHHETNSGGSAYNLYRVLASAIPCDITSLHLLIRKEVLSEEDRQKLDEICKFFGPEFKRLKIWSPKIEVQDFLDFDTLSNLTILDFGHEHNVPLQWGILDRIAVCSRKLEDVRIRCNGDALRALKRFSSSLKKLTLSIPTPWFMDQNELDKWAEDNVNLPLIDGFTDVSWKLMSLTIIARRIKLPYDYLNLSSVQYLDLDVGLFGELQRLKCATSLKYLTYSYYGYNFLIHPEMDIINNLLEAIPVNIDQITLKVPFEFKNRNEMIDMLAAVVEDFGYTTFNVTGYWNLDVDEVLESDNDEEDMDLEDTKNLETKLRNTKKSNGSVDSGVEGSVEDTMKSLLICEETLPLDEEPIVMKPVTEYKPTEPIQCQVMRMENMRVEIRETEEDQKHFAKYIDQKDMSQANNISK